MSRNETTSRTQCTSYARLCTYSVHTPIVLEVRHAPQHLEHDVRNDRLRQRTQLEQDVAQRAAIHVLQRNRDGAFAMKRAVEAHKAAQSCAMHTHSTVGTRHHERCDKQAHQSQSAS